MWIVVDKPEAKRDSETKEDILRMRRMDILFMWDIVPPSPPKSHVRKKILNYKINH